MLRGVKPPQSAPQKRRAGRPRSEPTRVAILQATFELVTARGYENVTTELIAEHARAGKQTLYRWWDSKPALVLDALAEHGRSRIDAAQRRAIAASDLTAFLRATFRALKSSGPTLRHLMAAAQSDDSLRRALLARLIEPRRKTLRLLLAQRYPDMREREAAVTMVYGAMWYRLLLGEPLNDALAARLAHLLARPQRGAR